MRILHVRNVPQELYEQIRQLSERERRSIGGQVIVLLEQAVRRALDQHPPATAASSGDREADRRLLRGVMTDHATTLRRLSD